MMKKILHNLAALIAGLGLLAGCGGEDEAQQAAPAEPAAPALEVLRVGVEGAYPPFSFVDKDGKLGGFDIDIAYALCAEMNMRCELITQDWDGMIPALLAKKYDAIIASMSITEERKQKVAFSDRYYRSPARFIHKKGATDTISAAGLAGKQVGVQRGTVSDRFITGTFGEAVNIKRYGTQEEAYLDLEAARLDMIFADAFVLLEFLGSERGAPYEFIGESYTDPAYFGEGIGIATRKEDSALVSRLNAAIAALRANGEYDRLRARYFTFDIYGE